MYLTVPPLCPALLSQSHLPRSVGSALTPGMSLSLWFPWASLTPQAHAPSGHRGVTLESEGDPWRVKCRASSCPCLPPSLCAPGPSMFTSLHLDHTQTPYLPALSAVSPAAPPRLSLFASSSNAPGQVSTPPINIPLSQPGPEPIRTSWPSKQNCAGLQAQSRFPQAQHLQRKALILPQAPQLLRSLVLRFYSLI